jgi:anti-sigma regulatory factor (Ser/Thr protein kinase)
MQSGYVLTFPGTLAGFARAFDDLRRRLDGHPLGRRTRYNCELVFDEVVTNVIRHAYRDTREHEIEVTVEFPGESVVMRFEDDGVPFDPASYQPEAPSGTIVDVKVGGRGLLLLHSAAQRLEYERTSRDRNRLTVTIGERN